MPIFIGHITFSNGNIPIIGEMITSTTNHVIWFRRDRRECSNVHHVWPARLETGLYRLERRLLGKRWCASPEAMRPGRRLRRIWSSVRANTSLVAQQHYVQILHESLVHTKRTVERSQYNHLQLWRLRRRLSWGSFLCVTFIELWRIVYISRIISYIIPKTWTCILNSQRPYLSIM